MSTAEHVGSVTIDTINIVHKVTILSLTHNKIALGNRGNKQFVLKVERHVIIIHTGVYHTVHSNMIAYRLT